ncbi:hypothetical protein GF327_05050 [Candidatus Woesearchaeota archaeon]|nr:hypothetical protein [Candidatus Woesearchaeota archaeon]
MSTKTIKGVNENTWSEFKSMAAENKKKMGEFFSELVDFYKKKKVKKFWKDVLSVKEPISDYEAIQLRKTVKSLRKESGFRKIKWD